LINQVRAATLQPRLGLLGPSIYPLLGTTCFVDVTSGSNGAYSAGPGYDMVTGIGVPNLTALVGALGPSSYPPVILKQPATQTVMPGQNASFFVEAFGKPLPSYRWQRQPLGSATWSDLNDNATYGGVATATLTVNGATETMNGDSFQCVITNPNGTVTTDPPVYLGVSVPLVFTTLAGQSRSSGSADGSGSAARFFSPADLAADAAGNVYVADANNHTIRKITPAGVVSTLAGLAGVQGSTDGTGSAARFYLPLGVSVGSTGVVYVADTYNHTIRQITPAGAVTTVAGQAGYSGSTDATGTAAQFNQPTDVTVDGSGNLFVSDNGNLTVRKITPAGVVTTFAGSLLHGGSGDGTGSGARFNGLQGICMDGAGNVYVADSVNNAIRKIDPAAAVTTVAGLPMYDGSVDGVSRSARFSYPADVAADAAGNIYVADCNNGTVRKISPSGMVTTVAGQAGAYGSDDGFGSAARFLRPTGVAVDGSGSVYVADTDNHTIRKGVTASAPVIQTQPQSQTVTAGNSVQLSVTATGAPAPTYQWRKDGATITGATGSSYSLASVQLADAGSYAVTVSNPIGSVTSNPATLTVNPAMPPPSPGGGGGGGGAIEAWFAAGLVLLGAARRWVTTGRRPMGRQ
jgi:hypothetical protein